MYCPWPENHGPIRAHNRPPDPDGFGGADGQARKDRAEKDDPFLLKASHGKGHKDHDRQPADETPCP